MTDAVIAVIVLVPLAITFLLKSNAALAYLSLCASFVLITFASADIKDLTKNLSFQLNSSTLNLIILVVPIVLTLLLTRKAFVGSIRLTLHSVVALCAGALLALVSIPLLNLSTRQNFADSWSWINLQKIQTPVIAAGVILSLLLIWASKHPHPKKHK
jgi:hypothetical protein